ncbi:universal stress protein [Flavobacterium sp.]|uniref:universal stress protein n=1 Tax=Flavobacterium sp. TaxID=239 RepID=UPI0024891137|nr:universal stress protein [Flavobacterium sp.]MDI1318177.1 universal stress protein [Flavobacterium sp.]
MKKVLIALDYGLSAQKIADKGYELAKSMSAKVTLLHVVADETYYSSMDSAPFMGFYGYDFFNMIDGESLIDSSLNFLKSIKKHLKDSDIETLAVRGEFASVILETAITQHFDIIVVGSHSQNWLERAVMGSVTESILTKTTVPMFIVPIKNY